MRTISIFIDVSNIYYCLSNKYSKKLDYTKYIDYLTDIGNIETKRAYMASMGDENRNFIRALEKLGIVVIQKEPKIYKTGDGKTKRKCDWDVQITVDIMMCNSDIIVIGSADGDLAPVVKWCLDKGKHVIILAAGISKELRDLTTATEIPESMLESKSGRPNKYDNEVAPSNSLG